MSLNEAPKSQLLCTIVADALLFNQGTFLWPASEVRPDTVLGASLEALDSLRTELRCYVMWAPRQSHLIILSENEWSVDEAIVRLRGTVDEIRVRGSRPSKVYLVEPMHFDAVQREVKLVHRPTPASGLVPKEEAGTTEIVLPALAGGPPTAKESLTWSMLQPSMTSTNEAQLRQSIATVLPGLQCYRGHVKARVRFGDLSLVKYKRPEGEDYTVEEFAKMIRNPQSIAELNKA